MNPIVPSLLIATGSVLASRLDCQLLRLCGVVMVGGALALTAVPALADEHILAPDNGEGRCNCL